MIDRSLRSFDASLQAIEQGKRQSFQNIIKSLRDIENSLHIHNSSLFRRLIAQYERLSSPMLPMQNLQETCRKSATSVAEFVNAYTEAFNVPFKVRTEKLKHVSSSSNLSSKKTNNLSKLSISISSLHRFLNVPGTITKSIFLECSLADMDGNILSTPESLRFTFEHKLNCPNTEYLAFISNDDEIPIPIADLEKLDVDCCLTVRLFTLNAVSENTPSRNNSVSDRFSSSINLNMRGKTLLAWANVPLFDSAGSLKSGLRVVPLWPSELFNPAINNSPCTCINMNDATCMLILAGFHADFPVYIQRNTTFNPYANEEVLMPPAIEDHFSQVLHKDLYDLTETDQWFIWENRTHLRADSRSLPMIIWSAPPNNNEILHSLVAHWPHLPGDPMSILRFLMPGMTKSLVTEILVAVLKQRICSDTVIDMCLTQFVQAVRRHGSSLGKALVERASKNHELAITLYWLFAYEKNNCEFVCCRSFYSSLSLLLRGSMTGHVFIEEVTNQQYAVMHVMSMAERIFNAKNSGKQIDLQRELRFYIQEHRQELPKHFTFPCVGGADTTLSGLDTEGCAVLASRAAPLRLKFVPSGEPLMEPLICLAKVGDDLRNDLVALQLVRIMDYIWMSCQLDLR